MYFRIIYKGAIAFGEAYMDGDWTPGTKLFDVLKKGIETGSLESKFQAFFQVHPVLRREFGSVESAVHFSESESRE